MNPRRWSTLLGTVLLAGACGDRAQPGGEARDTAQMQGMAMAGMQMMPMARAHLDSMATRSPAEMREMMGRHQEIMSRMLEGMAADMRGMNMTADSAWTALTDSVRRDLTELPGVEGPVLADMMRGHTERVRRLLAMHEQMMRR